jgi:hypothetical protein
VNSFSVVFTFFSSKTTFSLAIFADTE